jgi:hypothetical protein
MSGGRPVKRLGLRPLNMGGCQPPAGAQMERPYNETSFRCNQLSNLGMQITINKQSDESAGCSRRGAPF